MSEDDDYSGPASDIIDEIYKITENGVRTDRRIPQLCERALSLDPDCYPAHVLLGYYEMDRKNYDIMFDHFVKALELSNDPHNVYTWDSVIMALDDGLKDYGRLVQYLYKFYEREPELFVARYLARTLARKMNQKKAAVAVLNDYLGKHPEDKKAAKLKKKAEKGKWLWI